MNRTGALRPPLVELPFPSRRNPDARLVADQVVAWAERAGLLADHAVRARLAHDAWLDFAAWTYPAAPAERLAVIAELDVLMFLDDDRADEAADGAGSLIGEPARGPRRPSPPDAAGGRRGLRGTARRADPVVHRAARHAATGADVVR